MNLGFFSKWILAVFVSSSFLHSCNSNPTKIPDTATELPSQQDANEAAVQSSATEQNSSATTSPNHNPEDRIPLETSEQSNDDITDSSNSAQSDDPELNLERNLQEFDEKLLRELEQTQQARQERARQKAAVQDDAELASQDEGDAESGEEGSGSSNETADASGQVGSTTGNALPENANIEDKEGKESSTEKDGAGTASRQTASIPSGDDDDIVARQLREAAEAETDPELRKKLWEEYRKYKNQQGSVSESPMP